MTADDDRPGGDDRPETVALSCDRCGAPLTVGGAAGLATCGHCGCRLRVRRSASAAWTEVLDEIAETSGRIEAKVDALARRPALDALEAEWRATRAELGDEVDGGIVPPTREGARNEAFGWLLMGGAVVAFTLLLAVGLAGDRGSRSGREAATVATFAEVVAVVAGGRVALVRAGISRRIARYAAAEADYRRRRAELERDA